jgi:hypothetical protein
MRSLVVKHLVTLVPENPKVSHLTSRAVRKWKKDFWKSLSHRERGKRRVRLES